MSVAARTLNWTALIDAARKRKGFFIANLNWQEYRDFVEERAQDRIRYTFDQGSLEVMPTSYEHEAYGWLLGMFVAALATESKRPLCAGGQMTFDREDLERGLQPDGCYWMANAHRVQGKTRLDFTKDPSPDLFIEVEVSRTILNRIVVLAALGVPEVWRYDRVALQVGVLQADGTYQWGNTSPTFPGISIPEVGRFLAKIHEPKDHLSIVHEFQTWLRDQAQPES